MNFALPSLLQALLLLAPGDRLFATRAVGLLRSPQPGAALVRWLKVGDELAEIEPPGDDLTGQGLPREWCLLQTVDAPSGRSFIGYLPRRDLAIDPPPAARRIAILKDALERALTGLEDREKAFANLRDQVLAWRTRLERDPSARERSQALSDQLARYMEAEISPRALDAQDFLGELKELGDPGLGSFGRRLDKAARAFRP